MDRRESARTRRIGALLLAALAVATGTGCGPRGGPPSIVIISVDTLSRSALRAYQADAVALPALDAFAAESVRFENAFSTAPWTLPAHASLLTGLYPDRHGATHFRVTISPDAVTLAEKLRARGYRTVGFTDGGFVASLFGFDRGFDLYDATSSRPGLGDALPRDGRPTQVPGSSLFDRAISLIEARQPHAPPLFLFLQTFTVHDYFNLRSWARARVPESARFPDGTLFQLCLSGGLGCEASTWELLESLYAAELVHLDAGFARLRAALESAGLWESSVIFLVSDHGEGFDHRRGRIHHGGRLHADLIRIPLLVRVPGREPHASAELVSLVDVMPTVLELAGAEAGGDLDGRSFAAALAGGSGSRPPAPIFAMEHMYWWKGTERMRPPEPPARPLALAVVDADGWYVRTRDAEEFYEWRSDPRQERDRAAEVDLGPYRKALVSRPPTRPETGRIHFDEEFKERLRALGYAFE